MGSRVPGVAASCVGETGGMSHAVQPAARHVAAGYARRARSGSTQQAQRRRRRWTNQLSPRAARRRAAGTSIVALQLLRPAAQSRRETLDAASTMTAPTGWWGWLAGLLDILGGPPEPGTPEAQLEELRVGALLRKEAAKPPGQRDEELVHQLAVEHTKRMLANLKVRQRRRRRRRRGARAQLPRVASLMPDRQRTCAAASQPDRQHTCATASQADVRLLEIEARILGRRAAGRTCCAASVWVQQRSAASSQAVLEYFQQCAVQVGAGPTRCCKRVACLSFPLVPLAACLRCSSPITRQALNRPHCS